MEGGRLAPEAPVGLVRVMVEADKSRPVGQEEAAGLAMVD